MRRSLPYLAAAVLGAHLMVFLTVVAAQVPTPPMPWAVDRASVYYSPHGGCTDAIVGEIGKATTSVEVLAYDFTSKPIADALIAAKARGVAVTLVADRENETQKSSQIGRITSAGVTVYIDARHAIAHNKVMVLDGATVLTGSFNYSAHAENSNAENLLILDGCPDLANAYDANFKLHLSHSFAYGAVTHDR